jgi:ribosomal protein L29
MIKMSELKNKTEAEISTIVVGARKTLQTERFKDKFSRKASIIGNAKKEIARALTELSLRRSNKDAK